MVRSNYICVSQCIKPILNWPSYLIFFYTFPLIILLCILHEIRLLNSHFPVNTLYSVKTKFEISCCS